MLSGSLRVGQLTLVERQAEEAGTCPGTGSGTCPRWKARDGQSSGGNLGECQVSQAAGGWKGGLVGHGRVPWNESAPEIPA